MMAKGHNLQRRTVLIGGMSAALVGCDNGGNGAVQQELPAMEVLGVLLALAPLPIRAGIVIAGALRVRSLATALRNIDVFVDRIGALEDGWQLISQLRNDRFAFRPDDPTPRPVTVAATQTVNNFELIPVNGSQVTLNMGMFNNQSIDFGQQDIYTVIKRLDDLPPRTVDEAFGNGDLPHKVDQYNSEASFSGQFPLTFAPGAYVPYSWVVPRGQEPTDQQVATAFIGPPFISVDDSRFTPDLSEVIEIGSNVEAQYFLPQAAYI